MRCSRCRVLRTGVGSHLCLKYVGGCRVVRTLWFACDLRWTSVVRTLRLVRGRLPNMWDLGCWPSCHGPRFRVCPTRRVSRRTVPSARNTGPVGWFPWCSRDEDPLHGGRFPTATAPAHCVCTCTSLLRPVQMSHCRLGRWDAVLPRVPPVGSFIGICVS